MIYTGGMSYLGDIKSVQLLVLRSACGVLMWT